MLRKKQFTGQWHPFPAAQREQDCRSEWGQFLEEKGAPNLNTVQEPMFKTHLNARYVTWKAMF